MKFVKNDVKHLKFFRVFVYNVTKNDYNIITRSGTPTGNYRRYTEMKIADTTKIAEISAKKIFPELVNDGKSVLEHSICFYRGNDGNLYHCTNSIRTPRLRKSDSDMVARFERAQINK